MAQDMPPADIDFCIKSMHAGTHGVRVKAHSATHARVELHAVPRTSGSPERTWIAKHQNADLLVAATAADQRHL